MHRIHISIEGDARCEEEAGEEVLVGGGKHKHMCLEHLLRSWSNPVAQINVCGGVTSASGASLVHLGNAQIASDASNLHWGD